MYIYIFPKLTKLTRDLFIFIIANKSNHNCKALQKSVLPLFCIKYLSQPFDQISASNKSRCIATYL